MLHYNCQIKILIGIIFIIHESVLNFFLSDKLYSICSSWYEGISQSQKDQIRQHLGEFPTAVIDNNFGPNGTAWHWWMIAVLPLDPRIQVAMLAMQSYKERLLGLKKVLGFLKNKRDSR